MKRLQLSQMVIGGVQCALCGIEARALESPWLVGIDIPIGLPREGVRAADTAARVFVGPRRSTVFPTPPRAALVAATYAEARQALPSLSAQSFALGRKILEVEACLEDRVFEVHPEVSFAALASRQLRHSKRSWNGQMERRRYSRRRASSCRTS